MRVAYITEEELEVGHERERDERCRFACGGGIGSFHRHVIFLVRYISSILICLLFLGCSTEPALLRDVDREYTGFYNVTSGMGGVKASWSPADQQGSGHRTISAELDFKKPVEGGIFD